MKKNKLHFKHFRKFEDFPTIDFNDITFLVGKNNSGKSTFVKAFMLIFNYLKSNDLDFINFNQGSVETLNIVTFDRALCKTMSERESKENINFEIRIGDFEFFLSITGRKDSTEADVLSFIITDHISNFTLKIFPGLDELYIEYLDSNNTTSDYSLSILYAEKERLTKDITRLEDKLSSEFIESNSKLEKIKNDILQLQKKVEIDKNSFQVMSYYEGNSINEICNDSYEFLLKEYRILHPEEFKTISLDDLLNNDKEQILDENSSEFPENEKVEENEFDDLRYFYINRNNFRKFQDRLEQFIKECEIIYLPATLNKQAALFSIRDKNNPLAEAIFQYHQLELEKDPIINGFINKWFKEFQIGESISVRMIENEAFAVDVISNELSIPLADKGMGSIQAALLILRLASVVKSKNEEKESKKNNKKDSDVFVIIEEPELNLHPALQSKLCDLFFEVYDDFKVKFIIETHSEYIIRKTQLCVKDNEMEIKPNDNPFSVIYFNSDENVWNMEYREDGRFKNEFGSGFFDESTNLAFDLI